MKKVAKKKIIYLASSHGSEEDKEINYKKTTQKGKENNIIAESSKVNILLRYYMNIEIIKNKAPNLKLLSFNVDGELHKNLNNYPLTQCLNKSNFTLFLGKACQGKSSLVIGLLKTKGLFREVYQNIHLFCPPNSRTSISNDQTIYQRIKYLMN